MKQLEAPGKDVKFKHTHKKKSRSQNESRHERPAAIIYISKDHFPLSKCRDCKMETKVEREMEITS